MQRVNVTCLCEHETYRGTCFGTVVERRVKPETIANMERNSHYLSECATQFPITINLLSQSSNKGEMSVRHSSLTTLLKYGLQLHFPFGDGHRREKKIF